MKAVALAIACLAGAGHGSRIRDSEESLRPNSQRARTDAGIGKFDPHNALAMLLLESNPAAAFNPSGSPTATRLPRAASDGPAHGISMLTALDVPADVETNPIFLDEKAKLAEAAFKIPPDQLILLAKRFLASRGGFGGDPDLLADDFKFAGPVVGPLSKDAFVGAISSVDVGGGFPDFNPEFHGFQVDPFEGNRVWYIARGRGTNTGPFPPFAPEPTGKSVVNPPQACSLTFNEEGLVTKYTIGYVMDREVGTTGGLGGLYGIAHSIGKTLPFPEAQPWKKSKRYALFQWVGNMAAKLAKKK